MPKLPVIKVQKLLKTLKKIGFVEYHRAGSHIQLRHSDGRRVTLPFHKGKDIRRGTMRGILNDIGISVEDFIKVLRK